MTSPVPITAATSGTSAEAADLIAIDVGNSLIKMAAFAGADDLAVAPPRHVLSVPSHAETFEPLEPWWPATIRKVVVASVRSDARERLLTWLTQRCLAPELVVLDHEAFPISADVEAPERVGHDRLAGALAAARRKPAERAAIVIDAGSAITVDLVSPDGEFCGGAILPGLTHMARALHVSTDQLPDLDVAACLQSPPPAIGRNTVSAMTSGLYWGTVGAIERLIRELSAHCSAKPAIFATGGGIASIADSLPQPVQLDPYLVLRGILLATPPADAQTPSKRS